MVRSAGGLEGCRVAERYGGRAALRHAGSGPDRLEHTRVGREGWEGGGIGGREGERA